jgi:hypothetical protein
MDLFKFFFSAHLIFTYLISSLFIFLFLSKLSFIKANHARFFLGLSFGLGPLVISWLLAGLLALFPKQPNSFYLISIYFLFIFIIIFSYREYPLWLFALKEQFFKLKTIEKFLLVCMVCLFISNFLLILIVPNFFSDSIDYMHMAYMIAENKDSSLYPLISSHSSRSLIASWTHPLGFMGIYIWTDMAGVFNSDLSLQITSFFYAISLFFAFVSSFDKKHIMIALLSYLLLLTTPLYFFQVYQSGIDPIRLYTFFISFMFLSKMIQDERDTHYHLSNYIFLGFLLGMAGFSHSIGLLSLPITCFIYLILSPLPFLTKMRNISLFCMIPLMMMAPRLWVNFKIFHSLITDTSPVWNLESIHYDVSLNIIRGLGTSFERVFYGLLKGFTKIKIFGLSYWICFLGLCYTRINFKSAYQSSKLLILISALVLISFYSMVLLSFLLDLNVFIKNDRYILTVQPYIALLGGYAMYVFYKRNCQFDDVERRS